MEQNLSRPFIHHSPSLITAINPLSLGHILLHHPALAQHAIFPTIHLFVFQCDLLAHTLLFEYFQHLMPFCFKPSKLHNNVHILRISCSKKPAVTAIHAVQQIVRLYYRSIYTVGDALYCCSRIFYDSEHRLRLLFRVIYIIAIFSSLRNQLYLRCTRPLFFAFSPGGNPPYCASFVCVNF